MMRRYQLFSSTSNNKIVISSSLLESFVSFRFASISNATTPPPPPPPAPAPIAAPSSKPATSVSWADISNNISDAISTREVDVLLSCANQKLFSSNNYDNENEAKENSLTIETAVGLLQAAQFADIEIRSTEMYQRNGNDENELFYENNESTSDIPENENSSSSLQRAVPLYLSKGIIPLSFRQQISDGKAATTLLSEFLIHPNFCDSPTHQAILVDAAGKTLDRLASTVGIEAVEEFYLCVSSALEHLTILSISHNKNNNNSNSKLETAAATRWYQEIHQAEKQMIRESWRRLQRNVCKVNPFALVSMIQAELAGHLTLVRKCNNNNKSDGIILSQHASKSSSSTIFDAIQQSDVIEVKKYQKLIHKVAHLLVERNRSPPPASTASSTNSASSSITLSKDEAFEAASAQLLEEITLFDFVCAVDGMNLVSSFCLNNLPSNDELHGFSSSSSSSSSSSNKNSIKNATSGCVAQLLQISKSMTKKINRGNNKHSGNINVGLLENICNITQGLINICPQANDEWITLRDAILMADALARHFLSLFSFGGNAEVSRLFGLEAGEEISSLLVQKKGGDDFNNQHQRNNECTALIDNKISFLRELRGYHLLKVLHKAQNLSMKIELFHHHRRHHHITNEIENKLLQEIETTKEELRFELQNVVKNYFPRGTQQQNSASSSSSSSSSTPNQNNELVNMTMAASNSYHHSNNSSDDALSSTHNNNSQAAPVLIGATTSDYLLLQHAHVAVVAVLCQQKQQQQEQGNSENTSLQHFAEKCYSLLSAHKYYGVKVTSKMMLPMLRVLAPLGDSRVFNAIDVCTLFSGCPVTDEVLAEAFKTCAAAGDHHRARQLLQLLRSDVPGLLSKLPRDGADALVELGVVPGLSRSYFDIDDAAAEENNGDDDTAGCLPLNLQQGEKS